MVAKNVLVLYKGIYALLFFSVASSNNVMIRRVREGSRSEKKWNEVSFYVSLVVADRLRDALGDDDSRLLWREM